MKDLPSPLSCSHNLYNKRQYDHIYRNLIREYLHNSEHRDLLFEKFGIYEFDNNSFRNKILEYAKLIYLTVILLKNDNKIPLYDTYIDDIDETPYKKYSVSFNDSCMWLNNVDIYIHLYTDATGPSFTYTKGIYDSFVIAPVSLNGVVKQYKINFENTASFPFIQNNDKIEKCSICLQIIPDALKSFDIIEETIIHELKHVYFMFMNKKTNDEVNKDIIFFNKKDIIKSIESIPKNIFMNFKNILAYLDQYIYMFNKSEVSARLENINYNINKIDKNIIKNIKQGNNITNNIIQLLYKNSDSFADYFELNRNAEYIINKSVPDNIKKLFAEYYIKYFELMYNIKLLKNNNYIKAFDNLFLYYLKLYLKILYKCLSLIENINLK